MLVLDSSEGLLVGGKSVEGDGEVGGEVELETLGLGFGSLVCNQ
jgi:hypothetical protein